MQLSIISPVYRSAASIAELIRRIEAVVRTRVSDYEIILVDDGCPEDSWSQVRAQCAASSRVKGIRLSRNFGQHYAITAGLAAATGERIVVMDCDLQEDPSYIPELMKRADDGFDIVLTRKKGRRYSFFRNLVSGVFAIAMKRLANAPMYDRQVGNFSLLTRKAVDAFLRVEDCRRHYLMILYWLGMRTAYVPVEHHPRPHGGSSYNFLKLVRLSLDGITAQSTALLTLSIGVGFTIFLTSMAASAYLVFAYFRWGLKEGWTSLAVLILCSTGTILMSIGVLGLYLGQTLEQTRRRPLYLVDETLNLATSPQRLRA